MGPSCVGPSAAQRRQRRDGGWSLFETMISIGIIATGLMVMVQQLSISFRESDHNTNRAFAYQRAAALLGELQNAISLGYIRNSEELLQYADTGPNFVLTTRLDEEGLPFDPGHPMSGNRRRGTQWLWSRRISVTPHENTGLYYCRVQVDRRGDDGRWHFEASNAQLFSLLPPSEAPEQVLDVYVLACAGAPSLWDDTAELRTHLESAARNLVSRSQARVRLHWIDRLGYGRDPCYAPYVNSTRPATDEAPWAYWLPGALGGTHLGRTLYHKERLRGLHRTESGLAGGASADLPLPATLADQHNHCLRTPAAWRLFDQRRAAGLEDEVAPPLQLLLDDMSRRPERYRNAIVLNLHGSALPVPPLRNYSDAAREPVGRPGVRAVTHPARLWTPRDPDGDNDYADTLDVELRVHAWRTNAGGAVLGEPITVRIHGPDLTARINGGADSTLLVHRLPGGVSTLTGLTSGPGRHYTGFDEPGGVAPQTAGDPHEMWFEAGWSGGSDPHTWIRLHNTPLAAPRVATRGLDAEHRLYGGDYVPSPVDGSFAQDLAMDSPQPVPRNTARWRIRIPRQVFYDGILSNNDHVVRVTTRIGTNAAAGQRWPVPVEPLNLSETWTWWSRSPTAVPVTERSQFLGDPRLCPYADLLATAPDTAHGYNWCFDDLRRTSANAVPRWTAAFDGNRLTDGFGAGCIADAPRFLQLWREALQRCGAVLVNPTGGLCEALLLGGEIALGGPDGPQPVALHGSFTSGSLPQVDTVTAGPGSGTLVLQRSNPATWWAQPWLGELFPDDQAATWYATGNLAPAPAGVHWRLLADNPLPSLPYGTDFAEPVGATLGPAGATVLVNHGTSGSTFRVLDCAPQAIAPTAAMVAMNEAANTFAPGALAAAHTWALDRPWPGALTGFDHTEVYPRSTATSLEVLWTAGTDTAGGVIAWARSAQETAFLLPWTVRPGTTGNRDLSVQGLLLAIRALHAGGLPTLPGRIEQVPVLEIVEPQPGSVAEVPDAMTLRWQTTWLRFDGHPYTEAFPPGFAESESDLVYRILWSGDAGATWTSALSGQPAVPDVYPDQASERLADTGTGSESFTFALPGALPSGDYLFLVEAWRADAHCHGASHRVRVFVRGPD